MLLRRCGQWCRCGRDRVARPSEQENLDPRPQRNRRRQEDVGRRVRYPRVGALVQHATTLGADRKCPPGRVRDELLSVAGRLARDGETQLKQSPENPGRFTTVGITARRLSLDVGLSSATTETMTGTNTKLTVAVEAYFAALRRVRASGGATGERSSYPALAGLLNSIGATLKPKVFCVVELAEQGAGHPDIGLYAAQQVQRGRTREGQTPERGVVEVKSAGDDAWLTADSDQASRYWGRYRLVLVTNTRDFVLLGEDATGRPAKLETFRLADNAETFARRLESPRAFARDMGAGLGEYLSRVLWHRALLAEPKDLAWQLASYARDGLARVEAAGDAPSLKAVRSALEEALGVRFEGEKGAHFFHSTLVQTLFYGVFSAWVLWARQSPPSTGAFHWREAVWHLRAPVLRALFQQLSDPGRLQPLGLVEVLDWTAAALDRVDRAAFFSQFDEGEAVPYFYEPFLEAFDPDLRKQLGVWYTPAEVVRYMVARVDKALKDDLGIPDGLAAENVYVLDPCCGTGAYLSEVLRRVAANLEGRGLGALTGARVKQAATQRVFGFEIMPAPWGQTKREALLESSDVESNLLYESVEPVLPLGLPFVQTAVSEHWFDWPALPDLFPVSFPGVQTKRDAFLVDTDLDRLKGRIADYFNSGLSHEEIARRYPIAMKSSSGFVVRDARSVREALLVRGGPNEDGFIRFAYRPFDTRWLYWDTGRGLLGRPVPDYRPHVFDGNVWLVTQQKPRREWSPPQVISHIGCLDLMDRGATCIPVWLRDDGIGNGGNDTERCPNLSGPARRYLDSLGMGAEDLFHHVLATLHDPAYRETNAGALRMEWPRIPLPSWPDGTAEGAKEELARSAVQGRDLALLLDLDTAVPGVTRGVLRPEIAAIAVPATNDGRNMTSDDFAVTVGWGHFGTGDAVMPGQGRVVERPYTPEERAALGGTVATLGETAFDVYLNARAFWRNVPASVWRYKLGGYQILKKWLSYRERDILDRPLTPEEVRHFTDTARRIGGILLRSVL